MAMQRMRDRLIVLFAELSLAWTVGGNACAQGSIVWTQRSPPNPIPAERRLHAMAYDAARQRVVLFGGLNLLAVNSYADTWEWDGIRWRQVAPGSGPGARQYHAMAHDAARQRIVLFGGVRIASPLVFPPETWEWDGVVWTQRNPTRNPPPRYSHAMACDEARQRVLLFGGTAAASQAFGDAWTWDGQEWTQVPAGPGPPSRSGHGMAYDAARQRVVMSGGLLAGGAIARDTWEWDGTGWAQRNLVHPPPPRHSHAMAYDAVRMRVVSFGGLDDQAVSSDATWEWDGTDWTQATAAQAPTSRYGHAMAYDLARQRIVLYGGSPQVHSARSDTFELSSVSPPGSARYGAGCPGSAGNLSLDTAPWSLPWLGDAFAVELGNLPLGSFPLMMTGFSDTAWAGGALPWNLAAAGMPGCWLLVSADATDAIAAAGQMATSTLLLPRIPALAGATIYFQGAALVAGGPNGFGAAFSNGISATLGIR